MVIFVGAIVAFALFGMRPLHFMLRPFGWLPFVTSEWLEYVGNRLGHGFAALRQPKLMLGALLTTTLAWLALAASTWCVLRGLPPRTSPSRAALLVVIATNLAMILPSSPSGVGVFEAAALVALGPYGVPDAQALSCALVIHALNFIPFVVAGLVLLRGTLRGSRSDQPASRQAATRFPGVSEPAPAPALSSPLEPTMHVTPLR